jgi:hypothetical protein
MSVVIGGPGPNQVIRPGNLTVTGTATGRSGPEPVPIQSVTVNGAAAALTRTTGSVTVGFTATVPMPAWVPTVTITATAVDDLGFRTAASVTVRMGGGWVGSWSELYTGSDKLVTLDVAANKDGRLEVFGVSSSGTVWHTWQAQPGGAWVGSWSELYTGSDKLVTLDVAANEDGRLEVFGSNGLNNLGAFMHTWQTQPGAAWVGSWSELYSGFGPFAPVAIAANADGRLEVFGCTINGDLRHTAQTRQGSWDGGTWSPLGADLPEPVGGRLNVASNADGHLEVFVLSVPGNIWHTAQTQPGSWDGSWSQLPPLTDGYNIYPVTDFAVERNGDGRLELVANSAVWSSNGTLHIGQTQSGTWDGATWTGFYSRNDTFGIVSMARNADGRLEVFGQSGSGSSIWHTWRDWDVPFEGMPTGTIPSVIGLDPSTAMANIQAAGFAYSSADNPVKGTLQPYVEYQNPDGGTTALLGSAADVTIAVQVPATVPNVIDLSPSIAMANIQAAGFIYSPKTDKIEGNFTPHVECQDPLGGTTALQGSAVNVTIAIPVKGPPP